MKSNKIYKNPKWRNKNYFRHQHAYKNKDELYKLIPFLNKLLKTYKFYYEPDEHHAMDESVIKCNEFFQI